MLNANGAETNPAVVASIYREKCAYQHQQDQENRGYHDSGLAQAAIISASTRTSRQAEKDTQLPQQENIRARTTDRQ